MTVADNGKAEREQALKEALSDVYSLLMAGFTGRIILHCNEGNVIKCESNRTWRPGRSGEVELTEGLTPEEVPP